MPRKRRPRKRRTRPKRQKTIPPKKSLFEKANETLSAVDNAAQAGVKLAGAVKDIGGTVKDIGGTVKDIGDTVKDIGGTVLKVAEMAAPFIAMTGPIGAAVSTGIGMASTIFGCEKPSESTLNSQFTAMTTEMKSVGKEVTQDISKKIYAQTDEIIAGQKSETKKIQENAAQLASEIEKHITEESGAIKISIKDAQRKIIGETSKAIKDSTAKLEEYEKQAKRQREKIMKQLSAQNDKIMQKVDSGFEEANEHLKILTSYSQKIYAHGLTLINMAISKTPNALTANSSEASSELQTLISEDYEDPITLSRWLQRVLDKDAPPLKSFFSEWGPNGGRHMQRLAKSLAEAAETRAYLDSGKDQANIPVEDQVRLYLDVRAEFKKTVTYYLDAAYRCMSLQSAAAAMLMVRYPWKEHTTKSWYQEIDMVERVRQDNYKKYQAYVQNLMQHHARRGTEDLGLHTLLKLQSACSKLVGFANIQQTAAQRVWKKYSNGLQQFLNEYHDIMHNKNTVLYGNADANVRRALKFVDSKDELEDLLWAFEVEDDSGDDPKTKALVIIGPSHGSETKIELEFLAHIVDGVYDIPKSEVSKCEQVINEYSEQDAEATFRITVDGTVLVCKRSDASRRWGMNLKVRLPAYSEAGVFAAKVAEMEFEAIGKTILIEQLKTEAAKQTALIEQLKTDVARQEAFVEHIELKYGAQELKYGAQKKLE